MVIVCGHRGAKGHVLENTLPAICKAIALGVDMIEIDARQCRTGEIVLMHDARIDRTTTGKGRVHDLSFADLRRVRTKNKAYIPRLEEVLAIIPRQITVNIEVKDPGAIAQVIAIVKRVHAQKQVIITSSFDTVLIAAKQQGFQTGKIFWSYAQLRKTIPRYLTGMTLRPLTSRIILARAQTLHVDYIMVQYLLVSARMIARAHAKGLQVGVWTVDDPRHIKKCIAYGADCIISNYPERIHAVQKIAQDS